MSDPRPTYDELLAKVERLEQRLQPEQTGAIAEANERMERLFETMIEGVVLLAPDGRITMANPAAQTILGLARSAIQERTYDSPQWRLLRPDRTEMPPEETAGGRVLAEKKAVTDVEMGVIRPDGRVSWLSVNACPIFGPSGELSAVVVTFSDITERKRAEEASRLARARDAALLELFQMFDHPPEAVERFVIDAAMKQTASEMGFCGVLEVGGEAMVAQVWSDSAMAECSVPDKPFQFPIQGAGLWAEAMRQGEPVVVNDYPGHSAKVGLPPGHVPIRRFLAVPVVADGKAIAVIAVANRVAEYGAEDVLHLQLFADGIGNVFKRRQDAQTLRAGREQLQSILSTAMDGYWTVDLEGRLVEVNDAYCRMSGYSRDELIGMHVADLDALESAEEVAARIRRVLQLGEDRFESTHRRKDGSTFDIDASLQFKNINGGQFVCFFHDITERVQAEEGLRKSEYFFRESQRAATIGSYSTDFRAGVWESSEVLDEIFGIDRDYDRSVQGWLEIIHPDDREMMDRYLREEVIAERRDFRKEYRILRKSDGGLRWVLGFGKVSFDAEGNIISMIGTIQDVTERKRAEQDKARLEAQLLQSQKMEAVGQLAGGIAHDFNNILAAMIMQLEMLRLEPHVQPEELNEAVSEMLESANRAANLTRQLLLFSRRQAMKSGRLDANVLLGELTKLLRRLIGERVAVVLELSNEPLWFDGDASMIEQVITNLCVNARDAMPNGGQITIATSAVVIDDDRARRHGGARPGRYVCLEVSDTGSGIESSILQHVFEPFFTTKEQGKGTGLGLATVHGIVTKHGGFVEVASETGKGSTFRVYLPSVSTEAAAEPLRAPVGGHGQGERILVVEDEALVRRMAVRCLQQVGYRVAEAENGVEALKVWEQEGGSFDLLFTDMVMPERISGLELCARLRQFKEDLPAIVASGYSAEIVEDENLEAHRFTFLPKPYDIATLAATVRECLEKKGSDARN